MHALEGGPPKLSRRLSENSRDASLTQQEPQPRYDGDATPGRNGRDCKTRGASRFLAMSAKFATDTVWPCRSAGATEMWLLTDWQVLSHWLASLVALAKRSIVFSTGTVLAITPGSWEEVFHHYSSTSSLPSRPNGGGCDPRISAKP
jgi:hypothetical protein